MKKPDHISDLLQDNLNYYELLKRPEWQKKRLEIMQRDNFTCCHCSNKQMNQLHVHHLMYHKIDNNRYELPWNYPNHYYLTLCEECHEFANLRTGVNGVLMDYIKPFIKNKGNLHWEQVISAQARYIEVNGIENYLKLLDI